MAKVFLGGSKTNWRDDVVYFLECGHVNPMTEDRKKKYDCDTHLFYLDATLTEAERNAYILEAQVSIDGGFKVLVCINPTSLSLDTLNSIMQITSRMGKYGAKSRLVYTVEEIARLVNKS